MRFLTFAKNGVIGLAVHSADGWHGLLESEAGYPGPLESLLARSAVASQQLLDACLRRSGNSRECS